MTTGFTYIDGKQYYFYPANGDMAKHTIIDSKLVDSDGTIPFEKATAENIYDYVYLLLDLTTGRSIRGIYDYQRQHMRYRLNEKLDTPEANAARFLNTGIGACWDYASLTYVMAKALGYDCYIITGPSVNASEHNWALIEVEPGVWRHFDAEWKDDVYWLTDAEMDAKNAWAGYLRFQWDRSAYPAAV